MQVKEKMRKILGGILIGGLLLGGSGLALATTNEAGTSDQSKTAPPVHGSKMPGGMQKNKAEINQTVLDKLVAAGSLTQTQADAILAQEKQIEADRQAQMEALKNMTQEEREAYREANKPEKADLFTQLVEAGTITQEQAELIQSAMRTQMQEQKQAEQKTALNSLVEKNVISAEQAAAILEKIAQDETARQAEMAATKDMTQEEREAYREQNKTTKTNWLSELVTAGTLTQAQADEVSQVLHQGGKGPQGGQDKQPGHGKGPKNAGTNQQTTK